MFFPAPSRILAKTLGNIEPEEEYSYPGYERDLITKVYGSKPEVMSNPELEEIKSGWKLKECSRPQIEKASEIVEIKSKSGWKLKKCSRPQIEKASEIVEIKSKSGWKLKKCKKGCDPEVMKLPSDSEHGCRKRKRKKCSDKVDSNSGWKPKLATGDKLKGRFMKRFLSNHGKTTHLVRFNKREGEVERVGFNFLKGKYLLVCYFSVPLLSCHPEASACRAIIDAYDDLSQDGPPFEMIVVARMRRGNGSYYDQKAAFDHFYSAFSCLAIPFSDFETRDYICSCMKEYTSSPSYCIMVSSKGRILRDNGCFDTFLVHGGSEWAPFRNSTLNWIYAQDELLRLRLDPWYWLNPLYKLKLEAAAGDGHRNLSLYEDILLCDPNLILHRFGPETSHSHIVSTVLDLSYKYVGLYLCFDGRILKDIKAAHDNCLAKNQQLEIVLVCMPMFDQPDSFYKDLYERLRLLDVKSWFLFDYNSKVCRRLFRIFQCDSYECNEKFVIIPPQCESGELYGREIITKFGIDEYPFTRSSIVKRKLESIRSFTPVLLSLFDNCVFQNGVKVESKELRSKNVLLYVADEMWSESDVYVRQMLRYVKFEVVYVPWVNVEGTYARRGIDLDGMPWPYMSPHAAANASIRKLITFPQEEEEELDAYVVAVRKDGRIVSRNVEDRLPLYSTEVVTESLFDDVLEKELGEKLFDIVQN